MKKESSPKRVVSFLFGLRKVSPVMCTVMAITQIAYAILTAAIAPIFISQLLTNIAKGTATFDNSLKLLIIYAIILFLGDVLRHNVGF